MPCWTYQIAINHEGNWRREYVCAEDRVGACQAFLEENPALTIDYLLDSDELEVEKCE